MVEAVGDPGVGHDFDVILVRGDAEVRHAGKGIVRCQAGVRDEDVGVGMGESHGREGRTSGFGQLRQTGGGDGLPLAFFFLVGHVQFDLRG
jgi:hypothetical protein